MVLRFEAEAADERRRLAVPSVARHRARSVDVDAAIPIGLIVTELLTNAFKYVRIGLASRSGYGELTIMDDGVGLPARDGSGFRIVHALVKSKVISNC